MNTNIITKKLSPKKLKSYPPATTAVGHVGRGKLQANRFHPSASRNLQLRLIGGRATTKNPTSSAGRLQPNRGFTLIEMLVSISVFMVVMLVAASSLLSIIDGNNKAQSLKSAINNLNFALESMQKNIRVGTSYSGGGSCSPADTCIIFDSYKDLNGDGNMDNDTVIYKYNDTEKSIERCENISGVTCSLSSNFTRLTAPEVKITDMKFYIDSSSQPRVLITISGEAGTKERIKTNFNLQTTVSQRSF